MKPLTLNRIYIKGSLLPTPIKKEEAQPAKFYGPLNFSDVKHRSHEVWGNLPSITEAVCRLIIDFGNARFFGTGFLISKRCVITAGHNIFIDGKVPTNVFVYPGVNSSQQNTFYKGKTYHSLRHWVDFRNKNYDFGAITLNEDYQGKCLELDYPDDNDQIEVVGYSRAGEYFQRRSTGQIKGSTPHLLFHTAKTLVGMSGSPLIIKRDNKEVVVGIHFYGDYKNYAIKIGDNSAPHLLRWSQIT